MKRLVTRAGLYARTLANLEPHQITGRVRRQAQQRVIHAVPGPFARRWLRRRPGIAGWPVGFTPLDADVDDPVPAAEACAAGRFTFLDETRTLGHPAGWEQADAAHLWRFCLHDFHWAWAFAAHPERAWARAAFADLWRSWRAAVPLGHVDGWSPYVASVRAWVWCGLYAPLVAGSGHAEAFRRDLAVHAGFIKATIERDLGGNHFVKNLKALIGLGVFLADARLADQAVDELVVQLDVQVLADGGHFELSPAYHCQVLGDLIDVAELLGAAGRPVPGPLADAIERMRGWLGAMLMPDGDIPLFSDSVLQGRKRIGALRPTPCDERLTVLQPSGYVVARIEEGTQLVCDVGPPGPPTLPAHAHADCLSFELAIDSQRVIVDTGASTYEPGHIRAYERSTRAHNTVTINGTDQSELWASFRAGHLARATLQAAHVRDRTTIIRAAHSGYAELLPGHILHTRIFTLSSRELEVKDAVTGRGRHLVSARMNLPQNATISRYANELFVRVGDFPLSVSARALGGELLALDTVPGWTSVRFGQRNPSVTLEIGATVTLPYHHRIILRW